MTGPPTDLPLQSVTTDIGSSRQLKPLDRSTGQPWVVETTSSDDAATPKEAKVPPEFALKFAKPVSVTSVETGKESGLSKVDLVAKNAEGETTIVQDVPVTPSGRVLIPASIIASTTTHLRVILKSLRTDSSIEIFRVNPSAQGCLREETTVAPTTTSVGQTVPSTTTTVTTSPTTGAVTTQTVPSTTTTLSSPTAAATTTSGTPTFGSTTAVTVVTTTTTPTVTTTVYCPLSDRMPSQAPTFGEDDIEVVNANENSKPPESQPGAIDWQPAVPSKNEPSPQLLVGLQPGSLIQSVSVDEANAETIVFVIFYPSGKSDTIEKVVPEDGSVTFYPSPDGSPVEAVKFGISPEGTKDPQAETYDLTVKVTGCFEPSLGE